MNQSLDLNLPIQWIIVHDSDSLPQVEFESSVNIEEYCLKKGISGNPQRNLGLEKATGDFIYFLDDDNILHPNFHHVLDHAITLKGPIAFNQVVKAGGRRLQAHANNMRVAMIDTAQVIIPRELALKARWLEDNYCADGIYIETLNTIQPFSILNIDACYYNYLR